MNRYILLMRHGPVYRGSSALPQQQGLSADGQEEAERVSSILLEVLNELPEERQIRVGAVWHGSYAHVSQTAKVVSDALQYHKDSEGQQLSAAEILEKKELDPSTFGPYENKGLQISFADDLKAQLNAWESDGSGSNAILVAGHQPFLGWTGEELLKGPAPISRSEIICLSAKSAKDKWSLLWTIAPSDDETTQLLREKIKSKMDNAKHLGAFVIAIFGLIFGVLLDAKGFGELETHQQLFLYASAALFLLSIGLYFASMYAYDGLLMPARFWADKPPRSRRPDWLVWRPPSSATLVLYQNMMRIWNFLFTPATIALVVGMLFLAYAAFPFNEWTIVLLLFIVASVPVMYYYFRPQLGTDD